MAKPVRKAKAKKAKKPGRKKAGKAGKKKAKPAKKKYLKPRDRRKQIPKTLFDSLKYHITALKEELALPRKPSAKTIKVSRTLPRDIIDGITQGYYNAYLLPKQVGRFKEEAGQLIKSSKDFERRKNNFILAEVFGLKFPLKETPVDVFVLAEMVGGRNEFTAKKSALTVAEIDFARAHNQELREMIEKTISLGQRLIRAIRKR